VRRTQAVARLRHPNLVRMLPLPGGAGLQPILGEAHKLSDFTLPAGTFKRFDLEQVVRLLLDVLAGLTALHEVVTDGQAFVHGEVCPQNVYVDEHGTARLVPLLNGHLAPARPEATGYAAPERLLGSTPDARTDTFGVGVMLWEALAGKRLFPDRSPAAVLSRKVPPIELSPRTTWAKPLCAIAERAVAFEPNLRFQTAHELSNAIVAAAAQQLSRMPTDAWQEEAPTPVFQPRLHLPDLRASAAPPPAVAPVTRAPTPLPMNAASLGSDTVSPTVDVESTPAPARRARSRRGVWLALGALALGAAGLLLAPRAWRRLQTTDYSSLPRLGSSAAAARLEIPAPAPAASQREPESVVEPGTSAPRGSAAEAGPATAPPKKPRGVARPAPALKPKPALPKSADYGI
jgi:eukaryotic-like serine/threonine-protein kinase